MIHRCGIVVFMNMHIHCFTSTGTLVIHEDMLFTSHHQMSYTLIVNRGTHISSWHHIILALSIQIIIISTIQAVFNFILQKCWIYNYRDMDTLTCQWLFIDTCLQMCRRSVCTSINSRVMYRDVKKIRLYQLDE